MIPKYEQVKQDLFEEIKNHHFVPGNKSYSKADVRRKYSVSSITAVKALNELTAVGYLYRIQGKGTFVSKSRVSQSVKFSDIELRSLDKEKVKILSIEGENEMGILKGSGLPVNASYYKIKRVRLFEDTSLLVHITHLPKKLVREPIAKDISVYLSIYERVCRDFGIDLFSLASVETNEIAFPEHAELLNLLSLSFREPVVQQIKRSYLVDQSVAEYIISYKHWKYFKTKIEVEAE